MKSFKVIFLISFFISFTSIILSFQSQIYLDNQTGMDDKDLYVGFRDGDGEEISRDSDGTDYEFWSLESEGLSMPVFYPKPTETSGNIALPAGQQFPNDAKTFSVSSNSCDFALDSDCPATTPDIPLPDLITPGYRFIYTITCTAPTDDPDHCTGLAISSPIKVELN
jgi:hypothetical protein